MGMTMNIPAGCPVLQAQDEHRRHVDENLY
jgi:hypothetical protein